MLLYYDTITDYFVMFFFIIFSSVSFFKWHINLRGLFDVKDIYEEKQ